MVYWYSIPFRSIPLLYYSFLETAFRAEVPNPDSVEDLTCENRNSKVNPSLVILIAVIQSH